MIKTELAVGGMTCGACTSAVTGALSSTPGVVDASVSLVTERAVVEHPESVSPETLKAAIEDAGFDATIVKSISDTPEASGPTKIKIGGMTCGACTSSVTAALEQVPGVTSVNVALVTELAIVTHDPSVDKAILIRAIEDAGFDAEILGEAKQVELKVFGGDEVVEEVVTALSAMPGVNLASSKDDMITVNYDPKSVNLRKLIRRVEETGAYAVLASTADNAQQVAALQRVKEIVGYKRNMIVCIALGVPTMALHKLHHHLPSFFTARIMPGLWADDIISMLLVAPIQFWIGRPFYVKSFKALKARSPTMDVLVTFSTSCAFIYSFSLLLYSIITRQEHHPMYLWDTCAMIFTFVVIGKYLENSARGSTSQALSSLLSLVPERATLIVDDRQEEVPTDMLDIGDVVLVRPGEKVCADGIVTSGESHVSEAMLTGESAPVLKKPGDTVIGGTLNGQGSLTFEVTSCGNDTKLAQIVDLVKDAQSSRAPIQRYADSLAAVFVPCVLTLALTTFVCWYCLASWLPHPPKIFEDNKFLVCLRLCISVIVVACPCALGLATPTAVMVGTGVGAEHGILVKAGAVFEQLGHVKVVLFDKTGTLTTGRIRVVSTDVPDKWWPSIRAIERLSEHPAGKALANYYPPGTSASDDGHTGQPAGFEVEVGRGVKATVDKHQLWIGAGAANGVLVRVDGQIVGTVQIQDALRSDAATVVEQLQSQGYIVGVVSGDSASSVETLAAQVGIDASRAWSGMMPTDKVRVIEDLQSQGLAVAFVGDGINDSPALVAAAVGISIEGATHVAVESADVVLVQKSPIRAVTATLDLGKSTLRRIKLNLLGSVIYNAIAIPFAMGLLLPWGMMMSPTAASAAMAASSVTVVVSSTLLKRWKPHYVDEESLEIEHKSAGQSLWQRFKQALSFGFTKRQRMPSYERVNTDV